MFFIIVIVVDMYHIWVYDIGLRRIFDLLKRRTIIHFETFLRHSFVEAKQIEVKKEKYTKKNTLIIEKEVKFLVKLSLLLEIIGCSRPFSFVSSSPFH